MTVLSVRPGSFGLNSFIYHWGTSWPLPCICSLAGDPPTALAAQAEPELGVRRI